MPDPQLHYGINRDLVINEKSRRRRLTAKTKNPKRNLTVYPATDNMEGLHQIA